MTNRLIGPLLCGVLFSLACLAPTPAPAAGTNLNCNPAPTKLRALVGEFGPTTFSSSTTYANLAQTRVNFIQGGTGPSCVIVRFSAEAGAGPGPWLELRAVLDGVTVALPPTVRFGINEGSEVARSYDFIFPSVGPGNHTLQMQFRSSNGTSVFISNRSTIVLHKP